MKIHNQRLLTSVATSALLIGWTGIASAQQATADFDLGTLATPAHNVPTASADIGSILEQQQTGLISSTASGSGVALSLTSNVPSDLTYSGAYNETNNSFASSATANITNSSVVYNFTPTTSGDTAVAGSYQSRISSSDVTASNSGNTHSVEIKNDGADAILTGSLLVDNNDITAAATSNNSNSAITLSSGVDVLEDATAAQASVVADTTIPAGDDSDNSADILVATAQVTSGAFSVDGALLDGDVDVNVESVNGATVTVSNSDLTSTARGNTSAGSISSSDTTATITASTAVSNMQLLDIDTNDSIYALTDDSDIKVGVGYEDGPSSNPEGTVDNSTVTVSANVIGSTAEGNDSNQSISLVANALTGSGTADFADDDATTAGVQAETDADAVVANVQVTTSTTTVEALTDNSVIRLYVVDDVTDVTNNTLEVTANAISSTARGADTSNSLALQAGSTMSATGAVTSVQEDNGSTVTANVLDSNVELQITDGTDSDDVVSSTLAVTSNSISASATGARANNDLAVASGTNTLSFDSNTGNAVVIDSMAVSTSDTVAPTASAGLVLVNDQSRDGGSVSALAGEDDADFGLVVENGEDLENVTANLDDNSVSSTAVGATADNLISLNFNDLAGSIATLGDNVAVTANSQTLDGSSVTARTVDDDGQIVELILEDLVDTSTATASSNIVSASAVGNQTTNNDIVVNATDIVIADGIDATTSTDLAADFGDLAASGAFVAASVQEIETSSITASLNRAAPNSGSVLVETQLTNNTTNSTIVSDMNTLSALATGNEAANAVSVGTGTTSTIKASSVSANVQLLGVADIDGEIGVLGSDGSGTYTSAAASNTPTGTINSLGASQYRNDGAGTFTVTFSTTLTPTEQAILSSAGFTNVTATTADIAAGATISAGGLLGISFTDPDGTLATGDETFGVANFSAVGVAPTLNDAGVIITRNSAISGSTFSVSDNTIAGEVRGNVSANSTSVTATTVTASSTTTASTDVNANTVSPTGASTVVTNLQSTGNSDMDMAVAGSFAIRDGGDPDAISASQQNVDDNLQQSYATANRTSNAISVTATNSSADGVIENDQRNGSTVDTTSDLDLMAAFGMSVSTTSIDGNRNESVATGNMESSTFTADITNASEADGTATSAGVNRSSDVVVADAIIGSEQINDGAITAAATSDAFNEEINLSGASIYPIENSTASISSNVTIAQASANTSTLTGDLGTASTANYDSSGALALQQSSNGTVTASTNVEVDLALNDDDQPALSSTVTLDGNQASATARGNVGVTDLAVAGTNIEAGTASADASMSGSGGSNFAAFVVATDQVATATTQSNSSSMSVVLDLTTSSTTDTEATVNTSTASLSSNRSASTATSNSADNTLALGLDGSTSSLTATGALLNDQEGADATAIGGISVIADIDTSSTTAAADVNAVSGSQLSLDSNVSTASATGNTADNTVTAISTQITAGSTADALLLSYFGPTSAGYSLLNEQSMGSDKVSSTNVANTVSALLSGEDTAVASSTVSLSDNAVSAVSLGNDAQNVMTLGASGTTSTLSSTGSLGNSQAFNGTNSATAGVTVTADIDSTDAADTAMTGSTLDVSGNSSVASATNNNALNTLNATGTNMTAGLADTDAAIASAAVTAAYALSNAQTANGTLTATNTANSFTIDVDSADIGVGTSTVSLSSNTVEARATSNVAVNNSMGLGGSGTAAISATGAILNSQSNLAVVQASADSTVRISADSSDTAVNAVSGSTVTLQDNVTTALARGNVALNAMNVTSAAATGGDADGALASVGGVSATYGILNTQTNQGAITGQITGTTYEIALNSAAPNAGSAATGSTFLLSGNVADAIAYGNIATNNLTLASLNGSADDASAMVASNQNNIAPITASLSGSSARFSADGAVPGSTVGVTGNAFRSTAVGNYATSVVTRN
jgi:hypothetical protein